MTMNKKGLGFVLGLLFSWTALAGTNPISWRLSQPFPDPVLVGRSYEVTYTFTNNLPFALANPLLIFKKATPASDFNYVDGCSGQKLRSKASCTVVVTLLPRSSGKKSLDLIIAGYDNNQTPLPLLTTQASGSVSSGVQGSVTQWLPNQLTLGDSAPYTFTFTNYGQIEATHVVATVTQPDGTTVQLSNNSCGSESQPGTLTYTTPCTVSGTYIPVSTAANPQTITATLTFEGASGNPAVISTHTTVVRTGETGDINPTIVDPHYLPPVMEQGQHYTVQILFTNVSADQVTLTSPATLTCMDSYDQPCDTSLSQITSSCGTYLPAPPPAAACEITGTFTAPAAITPATSYTVTGSLVYQGTGTPATLSTSGAVIASVSPTPTRTIELINDCDFDVWFSLNGSAVAGYACNAAGVGCPLGTSCNTSTKLCYWNNPPHNTGTSYELVKNGGQNTVTIPYYNYGGVLWSGNISASLSCSGNSCAQADCGNLGGSASCLPGVGFTQPATQAEITMNVDNADSYDVESINGFSMPITMEPVYYPGVPTPANNYICGVPGDPAAGNGFGACDWSNVILPKPVGGTGISSGYYQVNNAGSTCNINSTATNQCSSGQLCGLYQDPSTKAFTQQCGDFLGYWSADQVCSYANLPSTVSSFFSCNQALPTTATATMPPYFPANSTLYALMACKVPSKDLNPLYNSCYLSYTNYTAGEIATCCGCVDWWNVEYPAGTPIVVNQSTQSCGQQVDPQWTQYIQPMIVWMKAACPSAYTFPFDDKSSGFSCSNNLPGQPNSVGYKITFCKGNTGLPNHTITDGR